MKENRFSRRAFIKTAAVSLAGATVTCSGLGYLAVRAPEVPTQELTLRKENSMNNRILVAYATRAGSTAEIACAVGQTLNQRGFNVDVKPIKQQPPIDEYQAIILGSAIRMGNWLPEAVNFIKNNQQGLNAKPVALFTVHMLNTGKDETSRAARLAYLNTVRPLLNGVEEAYFTGKMDFSSLSFLDRFIANMVKAVESDQRDWQEIRHWGETLLPELQSADTSQISIISPQRSSDE